MKIDKINGILRGTAAQKSCEIIRRNNFKTRECLDSRQQRKEKATKGFLMTNIVLHYLLVIWYIPSGY